MRYLAIDIGGKRTGFAIGSDAVAIVTPAGVAEAPDPTRRLDAIARAIADAGPDALVLGLPLNMDGSEGPAARDARHLADLLGKQFRLPVHLVDERLTTFAADQVMRGSGLTRGQKKQRRDALAAVAILRDFLAGKHGPPGDKTPAAETPP